MPSVSATGSNINSTPASAQDGESAKTKSSPTSGFQRRDIVSLSPEGQASGVMAELAGGSLADIDSQIGDAAQKLQRLKQAIAIAVASGDAETLEALADKVGQVAVQLGGLLGKITDRGRRIQVEDLLDLAKTLKKSAESAAKNIKQATGAS